MKKFIGKHRKLFSLMGILLAAVIISVMTFGGVVNDVIAGVFKGEDDKSKEEKNSGNKVTILEIVPQYGQQVLGYTIPGFEPITKEAIEAYPVNNGGRLDPTSDDFENATGWVVKQTPNGYVVTENKLEDAFNKNVLEEAIDVYNNAEIELVVKQANDVVASDIAGCDLIYVNNPAENNKNLLYYYDQIMNYDSKNKEFSNNVSLGDAGVYYDSVTYEDTLEKDLAMRLIRNSAGRVIAKDIEATMTEYYAKVGVTNTRSIFEILELNNYRAYNHDDYIEAIANVERGSISEIADVDLLLAKKNLEISEASKKAIYEITKTASYFNNEANKEEFKKLLIKCALEDANTGMPVFVEVNFESYQPENAEKKVGYFDRFKSMSQDGAITMESSIFSAMTSVNSSMSNVALNIIDSATADTSELRKDNIKTKLTAEVFARLNFDICNENNVDQYVEALCRVKGISATELLELITKVNEEEKLKARTKIAKAAGNKEAIAELTNRDFVVADLGVYNTDLFEKYKEELLNANGSDLISIESIDMPIYTDSSESSIVVHFKANVDWDSKYVRVEYISEESATPVVLDEKIMVEEIVNGYYRVVIEDIPENIEIQKLLFTFGNLETVVVKTPTEEETTEGETTEGELTEGETTDEKTTEKEIVDVSTLEGYECFETVEVDLSLYDSMYGEYWVVYDSFDQVKVFRTSEDIVTDENYGEMYAYKTVEKVTINEENLIKIFVDVNEKYAWLPGEVSYDFYSWDIAEALYRYSTTDESGLIFSTDIIKNIAKCKYDSDSTAIKDDLNAKDVDRTNLVYKALMSIKLYAGGKFSDSTLAKIDEEGLYYANGIESGEGADEWTFTMFGGTDYKVPLYSLAKRVFSYSNNNTSKGLVSFNGDNFISVNYDKNLKDVFKICADDVSSYKADFKRNWDNIFDKKTEKSSENGYYTLGDIIRYTMNLYVNQLYCYPLNVLEVQPAALVTDFGSYSNGKYNYYEGAKKLADMLRIDYSDMTEKNYKEYINIKTMSIREFNTQNKDLTAEYDLIYFGVNSGNINKGSDGRTKYNDESLRGCVYTGVGDEYTMIDICLRGSLWEDYELISGVTSETSSMKSNFTDDADDDYYYAKNTAIYNYFRDYKIWAKYFVKAYGKKFDSSKVYGLIATKPKARTAPNDITIKKSNELMEYLKAGYPILFDDKVLYANEYQTKSSTSDSTKWTYVDFNSKLYHFVEDAKKLGYDSSLKQYTGKDEDGNNVFVDGGRYASLVSVKYAKYGSNPENLITSQMFRGGLSFAVKRNFQIDFEYKSGPLEYDDGITAGNTGNIIPYKKSNGTKNSSYSTYRFVLGVPKGIDMEWLEENYKFQVHVDKSGLGKFTEENTIQLDPYYDFKLDTNEVIIEGNWPTADDDSMGGFIPWRLEAYDIDNPNSHYVYTGYSAFEKIDKDGNPKNEIIEVLYVKPNGTINMNFETEISDLTKGDNPVYFLPEYTINCTTVTMYDFANNTKYWAKDDDGINYDSSTTRLKVGVFNDKAEAGRKEKEFNMIVFGYCDSYKGMDIDNINALRNIDYFVSSGHSLIFSHDNSGEVLSVNNYAVAKDGKKLRASSITGYNTSNTNGYIYGKYTTAYLRAMFGMDAFGVSYSPEAFVYGYKKKSDGTPDYTKPVTMKEADANTYVNPEYVEAMYNARLYTDDSKGSEIFRGLCEGTVMRKQDGNATNKSLYKTNGGTGSNIMGKSTLPNCNSVRFVNKGQITMYPYVLGDEGIPIYNTHFQYLALNLEDEDVQVWATYHSDDPNNYYGATTGDGANSYYIYTKGNITYSGTGHSKSGLNSNNDMERKLFLNTVVAAIKAGNFGPEIDFTNSGAEQNGESIIYSYDSEDFVTFKFKVTDVDSKTGAANIFSNIDIFFDKIGDVDSEGKDDDANPFYHEGADIILNEEEDDIDIMLDESCKNKVNYNEDNVLNRVEYTIKISYADIATMQSKLLGNNDVYTMDEAGNYYKNGAPCAHSEVQNLVSDFFKEYRFAVTATDIPKEINGTNTKGTGITKSAVARVAFRSLFNLN